MEVCQTFFLSERSKVTKLDGFKVLKKTVKRVQNERSKRLIMDSLEYKKLDGPKTIIDEKNSPRVRASAFRVNAVRFGVH